MNADQPCSRHAHQHHAGADAHAQDQGVENVVRQDGGGQVRPGVARAAQQQIGADAGNWHGNEQRHEQGRDDQRGKAAPLAPHQGGKTGYLQGRVQMKMRIIMDSLLLKAFHATT